MKSYVSFSQAICWLFLTMIGAQSLHAAPAAELWPRWAKYSSDSTQKIDHSSWHRLLKTYVFENRQDGINRVNYAGLANDDRDALNAYLSYLSSIPISQHNRNEQFAYWINLYNALTVDTIVNHYPVETIKDISSGFFSFGPWNKELITVEKSALSLNDIEHRILRPIWNDPRIHYAVNCAALGCPNLLRHAFTAATSEGLLDKAARAYINHPRGAIVSNGELQLSSIYAWYKTDFGGSDSEVIQHLRYYAGIELKKKLTGITKIDDHDYDWRLNDADQGD